MAENSDSSGAVIGVIGIAIGALLANWDKVFPDKPKPSVDIAITKAQIAKAEAEAAEARVRTESIQRRLEEEKAAKEKAEEQEKIKFEAVNLADQAATLIVSKKYGGGSNIGVTLVNHEYYEGNYILTVELRWNANYLFNQFDLAANGTITASKDGSNDWSYKWNPSWQSEELNNYLEARGMMRIMGM
jgi:hypothetical protein